MLLIETSLRKAILEEISREKLPEGVLSRVTYNICNIDERNANKRVYEKAVWTKVLEDQSFQDKLNSRALFGHAEHPEQTQSDLQLTSHVIFEMWLDEDKGQVFQKFDILDTPTGRIVDTLLRAGCQVGVSTRAEGDLEEAEDDGGPYSRVIPESYNYVTTDFTADPSTFGVVPIDVRRNVVAEIRRVFESKETNADDRKFAGCLLESMKCEDKSKCQECGCCESKKIKEGTWALPHTEEDAQKIVKLMENPLTPEVAKKELYNLLGDDILYDTFDEAIDNKVKDIRPEIQSWITHRIEEVEDTDPKVVKILKTIASERKTIEDIIKDELIKVGAIVEYKEKKCEVTKIEEDKVSIEIPGADSSGGKEVVIGGAAYVTIHTDNSIVIQPKEDIPEPVLAPPEKEIEDMEAAGPLPIAQQGEEKPELKPGMPVETKDGIKGKIISIDEGKVNIETDDGTKILLDTGQIIISLITEEEPPGVPEEPELEEEIPEEEPEEDLPERKVIGPEDKIEVGETIEIRNLEDTKTIVSASKVTEVGTMIGDVDTEFHKVKTKEGGDKWYEAEAYALVKVDEAKMGVDYMRTIKKVVKDASKLLKNKDYEGAAAALEVIADDATDAARAAKKMKREDDAKAEAEKEKTEESKVDETEEIRYNVRKNPEKGWDVWDTQREEVVETWETEENARGVADSMNEDISETEDIHTMYKAAGLPAPDGKGIHTKAFHELAIEVAKGYVKAGDTGEEALEKAYPTAMKQLGKEKAVKKAHQSSESKINKESISSTVEEITDLRIQEASTRAERDKAIELLEELEDKESQLDKQNSGRALEVKVLVSKLKDVAEKDGQLTSAFRNKLEEKALLVKDLREKLNKEVSELKETITITEKKHQKEMKITKKKAVEGAVKDIEKEFISQFVKLRLAESGLKVDNNSQALLEGCKTLGQVDETLDKIRDIKRRSALHSEPIEGLAVVKRKDADPEQAKVDKNVGTVFEGFGYIDSGVN